MFLTLLEIITWLQPPPTAGGGGGAGAGGSAAAPGGIFGGMGQLGFILLMFGVFYFLIIRPQTKRQKELEAMLGSLKKGMVVRTNGGIRGEIVDLNERDVTLRVADKTKIYILRSHIAGPDAAEETSTDKN